MKDSFTIRLLACGRSLQRRRWTALVLAIATAVGGALHAIDLWGGMHGLQERVALAFVAALGAGALVTVGAGWIRLLRRAPQVRSLAASVEARHPELLDSLITAVERGEGSTTARGPLDAGLFRTAEERTRHLDFAEALVPTWLRGPALAGAAGCAALVFLSALTTDTVRKSLYAWSDWRAGTLSGIEIEPENPGVARGADVTIEARVLRWESDAEIEYISDGGHTRYPMVAGADDRRRFTFYDIEEAIYFRVTTPSLQSAWHTITAFEPPRLEQLRIEARPPAYTRMDRSEHDGVTDLRVLEGTDLIFSATVENSTAVHYRKGDRSLTFEPPSPEAETDLAREVWALRKSAERSGRYRVSAENPNTYVETREGRLEVDPDTPPGIEILDPARDIRLEPDEGLGIEVYATDDFGLTDITVHLSIAGRIQEQVEIPPRGIPGEPVRETTVAAQIDLSSMDVDEGDLVSYYVAATDNRRPQPQSTRSEVFFVEIRTDEDPEEVDGPPDEEERLELRAYIEELKRLIRLSHRAATTDGEARLKRNQEAGTGLNRLRGEVNREYEALRPFLEQANDLFFTRGFEATLSLLETAERLITRDFTDSSILSQEQALQELILMENELRQQIISRDPETGEGEEGEIAEGHDSTDAAPGDSLQDELARLHELLEDVRALHDKQNAQNLRAERAERTGASTDQLANLAEAQQLLRETNRRLERRMESVAESESARRAMRRAEHQMREAASQLESANAERGWREGLRASDALENAARHLQDRLDSAVDSGMQAMQDRLRELADEQRAAAQGSSEAAASDQGDARLHEEQLGINERFSDLLETVNRFAGEIGNSYPDAARTLGRNAREARDGTPGTEMTRAANALLYDRWGQAQALQERAVQGLEELNSQLARAGDELPALSAAQLDRMLEELNRDRRSLQELESPLDEDESARLEQVRESWSGRLEQLAERLGDASLGGVGRALGQSGGDGEGRLRDAEFLLREARDQLMRHREDRERRRILDMRRRSAPPPEQYRRQVEEYFRKLSEESE